MPLLHRPFVLAILSAGLGVLSLLFWLFQAPPSKHLAHQVAILSEGTPPPGVFKPLLSQNPTPLQTQSALQSILRTAVKRWGLSQAGVVLLDLKGQSLVHYQGQNSFEAGEFIHLPLLVAAYQYRQEQGLDPKTLVKVGSHLSESISQTHPTWLTRNHEVSYQHLVELMTLRQNTRAAHALMDIIQPEGVNQMLDRLGLKTTRLAYKTEKGVRLLDDIQYQAGKNTSSAWDMAALMGLLSRNLLLQPDLSQEMLWLLDQGQYGEGAILNHPSKKIVLNSALPGQTHQVILNRNGALHYVLAIMTPYAPTEGLKRQLAGLQAELHAALLVRSIPPRPDEMVPGIYLSDKKFANQVVLTFDDGPGKGTAKILDILKRHQIQATFFVLGSQISRGKSQPHPEAKALLQRMLKEGHSIGNHSFSHKSLSSSPFISNTKAIQSEIQRTDQLINQALGEPYPTLYFRPPYGERGVNSRWGGLQEIGQVDKVLKDRKQQLILWQSDSNDWKLNAGRVSTAGMVQRVLAELHAKQGGVVLFHDIYPKTANALDHLIYKIKATDRYQFVTLDQIMANKYEHLLRAQQG